MNPPLDAITDAEAQAKPSLASPPCAAILFFMPSMAIGGAEIAMVRLAGAFAAAGHRVALLVQAATDGACIAVPPGVELTILGIRHTRSSPFALARFAARWQADALIAALPHNNLAAITAGLIARARGRRLAVIVTEHAPLAPLIAAHRGIRYRILPLLQRLLYPRADAVVCVSHGVAESFRTVLPRATRRHVIYNPLIDACRDAAPQGAPATGSPALILAAGRLAREKDYPTLLRAVARLRQTRDVRLIIAGDGPERVRLAAIAAALGIAPAVTFPGFIADLTPLLRRAAVFVTTSRFEGFGNVIVEALACGTPVVATDCPVGPREILENGRLGTLVPIDDPAATADAIATALDRVPDRAAMRARAADFTIAASRDAYATLIGAATSERPTLSVAIYMHDLSSGGVEHATLSLIGAFRAASIAVTLLLHADHGPLRAALPADLDVVCFATRRTIADLPGLVRYLRRHRPDILLANLDHNNLVATLAILIARTGTRLIIAQHNALSQEAASMRSLKYRLLPLAYRFLAPRAHGIVAVSHGVADDLARCAGIAPGRITVIYNPVVDDGITVIDNPVADNGITQHPWLTSGIPFLVTAGRLVAQKDHETLIRAFALARCGGMRLVILGEGALRPRLEALIRSLGVADRVILPGYVADPRPWFAAAAAFVLSSRYEGFGNVLVEAMACGTPVISTDCPHGPAEILDHGRFGTLVPPGDPARLAVALDPDLRRLFPASTLRARAARYSVAAAATSYRALFARVSAGPS